MPRVTVYSQRCNSDVKNAKSMQMQSGLHCGHMMLGKESARRRGIVYNDRGI